MNSSTNRFISFLHQSSQAIAYLQTDDVSENLKIASTIAMPFSAAVRQSLTKPSRIN
jgi:DNA-binding XRE family transcriptional regulator